MYNYTKGDINKRTTTVKFSGYPVQSSQIDMAAQDMLSFLLSADAGARQIIVNSNDFAYTGISSITKTLENYGATDASKYPSLALTEASADYTTDSFYSSTNSLV
jgi:hypothetical protein